MHYSIKFFTGFSSFVIYVLFFCSFRGSASGNCTEATDSLEKIQTRVRQLINYDRDSAYLLSQQGLRLAKKTNDSSFQAYFYAMSGGILAPADFETMLKYYYKAAEIYKNLGDQKNLALVYLSMGGKDLDSDQQEAYLRKAKEICLKIGDTLTLVKAYTNLGIYHQNNEEYDSAMFYYKIAYDLSENKNFGMGIAVCQTNMAELNILNGNPYEALLLLRKAKSHRISKNLDYYIDGQMVHTLLLLNKPDSAFYHWNKVREYLSDEKPEIAIEIHQAISDHYTSLQDYKKANEHLLKKDSIEKIIQATSNGSYLSLLELEYKSRLDEEKMAKLNAEIEKADILRSLFIVILLFVLAFSITLFCLQKQKARKKRDLILQKKQRLEEKKQRLEAEQRLLSAELENSELKRRRLNDELESSNKELAAFATNIVQNHTLLTDMQKEISEMCAEKDGRIVKEHLKDLNKRLLQLSNNNEQRSEFLKKSRELNHSLVYYLRTHFSQLNDSDVNLLILLLLKFTSKEVAALYNIESESARKKRQRLRKKLHLDPRTSFEDFFDRILADVKLKSAS